MTPGDNLDFDFTHDHGGNGWAIIQDLGDNFYRVASITRDGIGNTAFLAWGRKLKRTLQVDPKNLPAGPVPVPLTGTVLEAVQAMRSDLAQGRKLVKDQRIYEAPKPPPAPAQAWRVPGLVPSKVSTP